MAVRRGGERRLRERAAAPRLSAGPMVGEQSGEAGIRPQSNDLELDQTCPDEGQLCQRSLRVFQRFRLEKEDGCGGGRFGNVSRESYRPGRDPHRAGLHLKVGCEVG